MNQFFYHKNAGAVAGLTAMGTSARPSPDVSRPPSRLGA